MSATPNSRMVFLRGFVPAFVLVQAVTLWLTLGQPPTYVSAARIQVEKTRPLRDTGIPPTPDPWFLEREQQLIQSRTILNLVIAHLKLDEVWGQHRAGAPPLTLEASYVRLREHFNVMPLSGTNMLELRVSAASPAQAAAIANEIATVYQNYSQTQLQAACSHALQAWEQEYVAAAAKLKAAEKELEELRISLKIDAANPALQMDAHTFARMKEEEQEREAVHTRHLEALQQLKDKDLAQQIIILREIFADPLLERYQVRLNTALRSLITTPQPADGVETPEARQLKSTIAELRQKLDAEVGDLRNKLQARVAAEQAELEGFPGKIQQAGQAYRELAQQYPAYFAARQKLESLQEVIKTWQIKLSVGVPEIDPTLDKMVTIVDQAQPSKLPVKPNKPLNIALGVIAGLLLGGMAGLLNLLASFGRGGLKRQQVPGRFAGWCRDLLSGQATHTRAAFLRGFILCFALTMTAALAITCLTPETYVSFARIHLRRLEASVNPATTTNLFSDSDFVPKEMAVLQSPAILEPVIQKLNLNEVWGEQYGGGLALTTAETSRWLRRRIKIRDTGINDLVEIRVTAADPFAAADLANAIAQTYQDYRVSQSQATTEQTRARLQHAYAEKQTELDRLWKEMDEVNAQIEKPRYADKPGLNQPHPDDDAKRKWNELKAAQDADLKRIVELNLPRSMTAIAADQAQPNFRPIKPNKPLNLALGAVGGILLGGIGGRFNVRLASGGQRHRATPTPRLA